MKRIKILSICLFLTAPAFCQQVTMKTDKEKIPTYRIGNPEADPIFFTGRVYQGAEGYIYPYPLYDILTQEKIDKEYDILRLSNQYVNIGILPEIGGRIFQATDKTDNYHFFYTQTGIKPALIGMLGAWLSGGVEWNVPDHHRASSYMPIDWLQKENNDGSKTVWVGETELRHRLKWSVGISVYPGRSWVEAKVRVINPTPMIQSMLYWSNVSVHCNEDYQVIFPPDVQAGADHSKVYFTQWPIGPLGHNEGPNVDLSRWGNFTMDSRSIFAWGSKMNFLAGYDFGKDAGTVHVANRFQVPGKKFFLWGNNPNGMMWNKILSDNDGHYLELMVGAYSDNQPDYSWINPGEIREFTQIWYPIRGIKGVKNATVNAAVNFQPNTDGTYLLGYNATALYKDAHVIVKSKNNTLLDKKIDIDPDKFYLENISVPANTDASDLYTALTDAQGNILVDYSPQQQAEKPLPKVIDGTKAVKDYKTNEELYLAGLRVDQFNNARLSYMDFYNEALRRDSMDARVNIEVGKHYIRQGEWDKAEKHLLRAQIRLSHDYTRVKNTEATYYLGYLYSMTGRLQDAEECLWAATYTPDFKHAAFYQLALLCTKKKDFAEALHLIDESLTVGSHDLQALNVKAYILRQLNKKDEAKKVIDDIKMIDPLDYWSDAEQSYLYKGDVSFLQDTRQNRSQGIIAVQELLEVVTDYLALGDNKDAQSLLESAINIGKPFADYPLIYYYLAYTQLEGNAPAASSDIRRAAKLSPLNNFPFRIEEINLFKQLLAQQPDDARLHYYYGNLLYYLGQKDAGLAEWYKSTSLDNKFFLACRNVGFGESEKGNIQASMRYYNFAIKNNPDDPLLLTESDKIYEKAGVSNTVRQKRLEVNYTTVLKHDDAVMRLISLYNQTGNYEKSIALLSNRHYHLWEGGGEIHDFYEDAHMLKGLNMLKQKKYKNAIKEFDLATQYPENLEVAPSTRQSCDAKTSYLSGIAFEALHQPDKAKAAFKQSATSLTGDEGEYIYYKILSLRKLNRTDEAKSRLEDMQKKQQEMQNHLMDNYAKFGEANQNVSQSNLSYYCGLVDLLTGDKRKAKQEFDASLKYYSGNIWAEYMSKGETY